MNFPRDRSSVDWPLRPPRPPRRRQRLFLFAVFAGLTFAALYGSFLAVKPDQLNDITGGTILINGQPLQLPVEPVLRLIALAAALLVALITGAGMTADW